MFVADLRKAEGLFALGRRLDLLLLAILIEGAGLALALAA